MEEFNKVFSSYYLGPIEYYTHLTSVQEINQDIHENFVKQSYRNRCYILSPNGIQLLTIPIIESRKRKVIKDVKISYHDNWQKMHWKSLEAAYRSSPYFEFYEDEFFPFYHTDKYSYLIDFNHALEEKIIKLLSMGVVIRPTVQYFNSTNINKDYRNIISHKKTPLMNFKQYIQVFGDRNGFAPNLSIVDLLFNEGPNAVNYLQELANKLHV